MADFAWEARGRTGELQKGVMDAPNEAAVQARLRAQQLSPTKVKKQFNISLNFGTGVDAADLVKFVRQFATMIDAGLPLVQCLEILSSQEPNKFFAAILRDIKSTVEQGSTFSDALRRHPKVFDELFTNLVQAGEVGGILDTILNRLAQYIEKRQKLAARSAAPSSTRRSSCSSWWWSCSCFSRGSFPRSRTCSRSSVRRTRCRP